MESLPHRRCHQRANAEVSLFLLLFGVSRSATDAPWLPSAPFTSVGENQVQLTAHRPASLLTFESLRHLLAHRHPKERPEVPFPPCCPLNKTSVLLSQVTKRGHCPSGPSQQNHKGIDGIHPLLGLAIGLGQCFEAGWEAASDSGWWVANSFLYKRYHAVIFCWV